MTVAIAALAEKGRAIVAVADKQLTDADLSGVKIDDVDVKGFSLANGWNVLYAGDGTFAYQVVSEANGRVRAGVLGAPLLPDAVMAWLRESYRLIFRQAAVLDVFAPRLLDICKYEDRTYNEATIRNIDALMDDFRDNGTADLLAFGFDSEGWGQIVSICVTGAQIAGSFAAVGTGGPIAEAHLSWRETAPNGLAQVVYEVLEAKERSERNVYVGHKTDAFVIFRNGDMGGVYLTDDTQDKLAAQRESYKRMPLAALEQGTEEWAKEFIETKIGPPLKIIGAADAEWRINRGGAKPTT